MNQDDGKKKTKLFGLPKNVVTMGIVSLLNDASSDMIFPLIPVFLTSVLGASAAFVGLVEGIANATAGILKVIAGRLSDYYNSRKPFVVFGYSLSAVAKPLLSLASAPWHVLVVRFLDRVGKGTRDAPRDALISDSTEPRSIGRAFGFHRAADTTGAAIGPLLAFVILPLINNNLRTLFWYSFFASVLAVLVLIFFVREIKQQKPPEKTAERLWDTKSWMKLGAPFYIFLACVTIFSLGKVSEAFLILRAKNIGVSIALLPIIYFVYNTVYALFSTPAGIISDKLGHRNTFMIGMLVFIATYVRFGVASSIGAMWALFAVHGLYSAFTDGVGSAIVSDLVPEQLRATAFGVYNAFTGVALLPASFVFGLIWDKYGPPAAFNYGAFLAFLALAIFAFFRFYLVHRQTRQ
jgi:MFS family permease